jgi:hypothetical protein
MAVSSRLVVVHATHDNPPDSHLITDEGTPKLVDFGIEFGLEVKSTSLSLCVMRQDNQLNRFVQIQRFAGLSELYRQAARVSCVIAN